jgi:hypothetical protein
LEPLVEHVTTVTGKFLNSDRSKLKNLKLWILMKHLNILYITKNYVFLIIKNILIKEKITKQIKLSKHTIKLGEMIF